MPCHMCLFFIGSLSGKLGVPPLCVAVCSCQSTKPICRPIRAGFTPLGGTSGIRVVSWSLLATRRLELCVSVFPRFSVGFQRRGVRHITKDEAASRLKAGGTVGTALARLLGASPGLQSGLRPRPRINFICPPRCVYFMKMAVRRTLWTKWLSETSPPSVIWWVALCLHPGDVESPSAGMSALTLNTALCWSVTGDWLTAQAQLTARWWLHNAMLLQRAGTSYSSLICARVVFRHRAEWERTEWHLLYLDQSQNPATLQLIELFVHDFTLHRPPVSGSEIIRGWFLSKSSVQIHSHDRIQSLSLGFSNPH